MNARRSKTKQSGNTGYPVKATQNKKLWFRFTIDLSLSKHRRILFFFLIGLSLTGTTLTLGAYSAYAYSESSEFCGTVCHTMAPQFTRYRRSAHANVECVECHVGPGFDFYVKSKIAGMRQLVAIVTNTYSRPIKSPVHDMRPARETCEECHTPALFKDNIVKKIVHFENDASSSPILSTLILKMGGWQESTGLSHGIHWHITNPVYYLAADEQRQVMLWVGVEQDDGKLKEYYSRDLLLMANTSIVDEARARGEIRKMDCIDCHNRSAHDIPAPEIMVDEAIETGLVSTQIPFIRARSIELLKTNYASIDEGLKAIDGLSDYYRTNMPETYESQSQDLDATATLLKQIFASTNFPDMNLDWKSNPNNENHTYSLGCFRCHDDKHVRVDSAGRQTEVISASCNLCHTVPIVGRGDDLLVEAPVIVGSAPDSHATFRWTIEHQGISESEKQDCYQCHGQGFCNNGICHNLNHPRDMLYSHADEFRQQGDEVCYICHQDIHCSRCHPAGVVENP